MGDTRRSYDLIARAYGRQFEHELDDKPADREFLDRLADRAPVGLPVIDLGCGPGQIGGHLALRGLRVVGVDLSIAMLRETAGRNLSALAQADLRRLPLRRASVGAVVAFYSLIHIPPDELPSSLAEIARVVAPGGLTGIAVHSTHPPERDSTADRLPGGGLRIAEMLSQPVDLDFYFYDLASLSQLLRAAGFEVVWGQERAPYPGGVEVGTRRAYVLARKST